MKDLTEEMPPIARPGRSSPFESLSSSPSSLMAGPGTSGVLITTLTLYSPLPGVQYVEDMWSVALRVSVSLSRCC